MKLVAALFAFVSATWIGGAALAQFDEDCTANGDDAIAARACASRALEAADAALTEARTELRGVLSERGSVDGRRDVAALDVTTAAWRNWRDTECALRASIIPDEPVSAAPVMCAVAMTRERTAAIRGYLDALAEAPATADAAPAAPVESPPTAEASEPAPSIIAQAEFGDWRSECRSNGACRTLTTIAGAEGEAVLGVTRENASDSWRIWMRAPGSESETVDAVSMHIDAGEPISLDDWDDAAVLELMRRGLQARASGDDFGASEPTFSLRGLTASMRWIEETQLDRTN